MNAVAKLDAKHPQYSPEQIDLIKRTICRGGSDDELQLFMYQCARTGLDALARQIYAVKRYDSSQSREVMGVQVSIDGFRLIAERSGHYAGQLGPFWCGEDGNWQDVWLSSKPPSAARVGVLRDDFKEPCWGVARFEAYAAKKPGGALTMMWSTKGDIMVAKCAEALALRKAFPQELSGLYTGDEMEQVTTQPDTIAPPHQAPQDGDVADGVANWLEKQKAAIDAATALPALYLWLGEQASMEGVIGSITDPDGQSPLGRCKRKAPEVYKDLVAHYQARMQALNK